MGQFVNGQTARQRVRVLLDQVDGAYRELRELSCDEVGTPFRVEMAERLETQERLNRGLMYWVFGQIADPPDETAMAPDVTGGLCAAAHPATRDQTQVQAGRQNPASPPAIRPAATRATARRRRGRAIRHDR